MEFNQASFNDLQKKNLALEQQVKELQEFSNVKRLNESQKVSQIGSWSWDVLTNKVEWSEMMYTLLGIGTATAIPSYELALDHVHGDDKIGYENALSKAMNNKEDYYFENKVVKKDLTIINVISRGACICNEKNELIRMIGTVQDVTLLKQFIETNKQLEQFANILSHDFKSPIRTIISFIGLLKKDSYEKLSDEGKDQFKFIEEGSKRLSDLVNDILEYSKLNSPRLKIKKVLMKEFIESIIFDLKALIVEKEGGIKIGWLPNSVQADRIKIRQVFQNIISNALKYTDADTKPKIEIYAEEEDDHTMFYIKDNGIGINENYSDKVFEAYERVHKEKSFSGTGIGLSISKRIIDLHNGVIGFTANEKKGSCFYFSISKDMKQVNYSA